ncbi:amidohydrolase family protein [Terrarubrum flagellatum]|uniref:amidohydrolase family protein n=1 Tax=Terrirubrum flagellatum TaxID=2895980 RepID=UPI00314533B4
MIHAPLLIRDADCVLTKAGATTSEDILIEKGRIAAIGRGLAAPSGASVISGRGRLVAPGLVNAHWHSPMQLSHGTADRMNHKVFMWENQVDTANRSQEEIYVSATIGCLQMLKTGATSVIDHFPEQWFSIDDVATVVRAFEDCGMRAVVALRIFDGEYSDILPPPERMTESLKTALKTGNSLAPRPLDESLGVVREAMARFDRRAGRIRIFPAPSNPMRCSDALLVACEKIAQERDSGVHCHLLETRTQAELARAKYGRSMVEHMAAIGAFSRRWSNAHCNWLSDSEIALMAEKGAVAVFNPESNLKIGSGVPPIPKFVAADVTCALGADGVSTNDNAIMHDAMTLAAILHRPQEPDRARWITVEQALAMGTTGGAAAMMEADLGTIEVGAKADLVLYDLSETWWTPLNDPAQQLVFGERGGGVRTVIVDGRVLVEDGRAVTIDEAAIVKAARDILPRVRARNAGVAAVAREVAALE